MRGRTRRLTSCIHVSASPLASCLALSSMNSGSGPARVGASLNDVCRIMYQTESRLNLLYCTSSRQSLRPFKRKFSLFDLQKQRPSEWTKSTQFQPVCSEYTNCTTKDLSQAHLNRDPISLKVAKFKSHTKCE